MNLLSIYPSIHPCIHPPTSIYSERNMRFLGQRQTFNYSDSILPRFPPWFKSSWWGQRLLTCIVEIVQQKRNSESLSLFRKFNTFSCPPLQREEREREREGKGWRWGRDRGGKREWGGERTSALEIKTNSLWKEEVKWRSYVYYSLECKLMSPGRCLWISQEALWLFCHSSILHCCARIPCLESSDSGGMWKYSWRIIS